MVTLKVRSRAGRSVGSVRFVNFALICFTKSQLSTIQVVSWQLNKLESKITLFHDMDNVVMRVRELLKRSKQRLLLEQVKYFSWPLTV
ncbi:hypothetical protein KY290_013495 [Solanum tuberosum]|uniref:SMARCC C-terminal domain-containing protein n=1 Tax=Solanum tuberosum TaxID=4113 RepID=A0ABQ7VP36_SOLTU|nr:hypothetical protein KY285_012953 [Solanum tuberosum]KAH0769514.1 hypothetical protein KY290_013495 [Solanum tuberosum]